MAGLTNAQFDELVAWCNGILKPECNAVQYASGLLDQDENETRHYEIRAAHAADGIPHTMSF